MFSGFYFRTMSERISILALFLLDLLFSVSLSTQGTYAYTGPDSHLHHGPITPTGQDAGVINSVNEEHR